MSFYHIAKNVVWYISKPLFRMEVIGAENIPKSGPVIICSNHISNFDPPMVGGSAPRVVHFLAKEELFEKKWLKPILTNVNAFPIKRGMSDRNALRKALGLLKEGKTLGLFPEGTRSKSMELGKGLSGVGFFALRSEATVVPCAIIGPYKIGRKLKIVYGKPVNMKQLREDKVSAKEATDHIMENIRKIIEKYQ
ncbi:1-acyl-sn-glycerol-3-phosphate acyltransferase [Pelagirhabdus alkalitolerans]|uniref:1-acyl-sn-glycerol-3-phosphate acyltransferase n=1 Tax=Pelagirhabdus alkalitolerans TaxID=1612202 RepID=A0A1G6HAV2_9BACI|nr:lysophospholipid acyltransferase family protein [Pelagirhabdus alkalitolerans]SDB91429.1 1-acyl-sn-glycerol-3-phosphate acyltransferase [Pelagirhabdus alkalitolerans]